MTVIPSTIICFRTIDSNIIATKHILKTLFKMNIFPLRLGSGSDAKRVKGRCSAVQFLFSRIVGYYLGYKMTFLIRTNLNQLKK